MNLKSLCICCGVMCIKIKEEKSDIKRDMFFQRLKLYVQELLLKLIDEKRKIFTTNGKSMLKSIEDKDADRFLKLLYKINI